MDNTHTLPATHEHLTGLRLNDLVAKIAGVTLKDTTRVMLSTILVAEFFDMEADAMLRGEEYSIDRPSLLEAGRCNQAFNELHAALQRYGDSDAVESIRALR